MSVDLKCWSKMSVVKTVQEMSFSSCSVWVFICLSLRDQLCCTEYIRTYNINDGITYIFIIRMYIGRYRRTYVPMTSVSSYCKWSSVTVSVACLLEALHVAWAQQSTNVRSFFVCCMCSSRSSCWLSQHTYVAMSVVMSLGLLCSSLLKRSHMSCQMWAVGKWVTRSGLGDR